MTGLVDGDGGKLPAVRDLELAAAGRSAPGARVRPLPAYESPHAVSGLLVPGLSVVHTLLTLSIPVQRVSEREFDVATVIE